MSAAAFNLRDDAGEVLCGVMWDPATSEDALSSSQATSNVLWALLPNARRKAALLRAAGSFWLTRRAEERDTRGMNVHLVTGHTNRKAFAWRAK